MCLAIPGEIVSVDEKHGVVDFGGVRREVNLSLIKDPSPGDYVVVHAGFAIQKLDAEEAKKTLKTWEEILRVSNAPV